ncbi:MAG: MFS transporter, partial [Anaerohalosphaera sp.]|nr:MFS transporter [Anaerohalosphaera sp.]
FVSACVADRFISAEKMLSISHLAACGLMYLLSGQDSFVSVLVIYACYSMVIIPTVALTTAVSFHHLPKDRHKFGSIRLWGTLGWIAVAWFFSFVWIASSAGEITDKLPTALKLGAVVSLLQGLYALTLPGSNVAAGKVITILPVESFRVIFRPAVMLLCLVGFSTAFVDKFYFLAMGPYLLHNGYSERAVMPVMSIGQVPEIFAMILLAGAIAKYGSKKMIVVGVFLNVWRFCVFALGGSGIWLYSGICCHGTAYTFIAVTAAIYLDGHCEKHSRTGVHQLYAIIMSGFAGMTGNLLAGWLSDVCKGSDGAVNYHLYWAVPGIVAAITLVLVLLFFPNDKHQPAIGTDSQA